MHQEYAWSQEKSKNRNLHLALESIFGDGTDEGYYVKMTQKHEDTKICQN
ncbi:MAG: hypothetical protein NDP22_02255 [Crenarchaeota archaeon]|nr:hypothetical protein [Thermoproteota archaeon]